MRGKQGHTIHFSGGKVFSVDELYDRFYDELVLWADTILNDMGEAEDLVQDFFVRLCDMTAYRVFSATSSHRVSLSV